MAGVDHPPAALIADLHMTFNDFGACRAVLVASVHPEQGATHAAGRGGGGDDVARCRPACRCHLAAAAPALQADAGIDHAGSAVAAQLIQLQLRVLAQLQARVIGKAERDAGIVAGLHLAADRQQHVRLQWAGAMDRITYLHMATQRQHPCRGGLHAQPGDREAQGLAGCKPIGVAYPVVCLQLLPLHVGLEVTCAQVPQGVAGACAVRPVLGAGDASPAEQQASHQQLQQRGANSSISHGDVGSESACPLRWHRAGCRLMRVRSG